MPGGTSSGLAAFIWAVIVAISAAIGVPPNSVWGVMAGSFCGSVIFLCSEREYTLKQRRLYAVVSFVLGCLAGPGVPHVLAWLFSLKQPPPVPLGLCSAAISVSVVGFLVFLHSQSHNPLQLLGLLRPMLRNLLAAILKGDRK